VPGASDDVHDTGDNPVDPVGGYGSMQVHNHAATQTVFSMNLAAQSTQLLLEMDPPRAADQLLRIEELAASALAEIQSLVTQLRPPSVIEEGLPAALRRLCAERGARDALDITLELSCEPAASEPAAALPALTEKEAAGLYAIAQEALTNIAKHSGAAQAAVRLELTQGVSCLEIEDRGAGFDMTAALDQPGHLGLTSMAERASEIGWDLSVESQPGRGTRIRATRPAGRNGGPG
jgi:signal transduction histidine kinase